MADWDGARYESVNALQQWVAQQALAGIVLDGDEQLLDVGCGDGRITAGLAARLPRGRALGIDPSPGMIAAARADHPELAVELSDVLTMDFDASVRRRDVVQRPALGARPASAPLTASAPPSARVGGRCSSSCAPAPVRAWRQRQ